MLLPLLVQNLAVPAAGIGHFEISECPRDTPLAGADVSVDGISYGTTNAIGVLDVILSADAHSYAVSQSDSITATGNFTITSGATLEILVCLEPLINRFLLKAPPRDQPYSLNPDIPRYGHYDCDC